MLCKICEGECAKYPHSIKYFKLPNKDDPMYGVTCETHFVHFECFPKIREYETDLEQCYFGYKSSSYYSLEQLEKRNPELWN